MQRRGTVRKKRQEENYRVTMGTIRWETYKTTRYNDAKHKMPENNPYCCYDTTLQESLSISM